MPTYKHVIHIPARTGLPRDDAINTLYFQTPAALDNAGHNALSAIVASFYDHHPAGHGTGINDYMDPDRDVTTNAARVDAYLMPTTAGPLGAPVHSLPFTWSAPFANLQPLPDQDAVVMSYQGDMTGVTNARKHRGRIFLGPLQANSMQESAGGLGAQSVSGTMIAIIIASAQEILGVAAEALSTSPRWVMWSHTDWAARPVVQVSVDDRFDVQRRRAQKATSRVRGVVA